jgi:hypothetical protein
MFLGEFRLLRCFTKRIGVWGLGFLGFWKVLAVVGGGVGGGGALCVSQGVFGVGFEEVVNKGVVRFNYTLPTITPCPNLR